MKLNQQISVMRKEIKNLRQMIESAGRNHRKHLTSLQSVLNNVQQEGALGRPPHKEKVREGLSLEQGSIQTVPIGYISCCFSAKNGTPRQPTICGSSRATLKINKTVFSNPQHALTGLEHYSHVWIIFLFHKNGHLSYKAKVKPPRLNGQRIGVFSTRSPHRPNALGLTLATLDKVSGDTLYLSGIDMIAGTPVLDVKPYIPDYDSPRTGTDFDLEENDDITMCSGGVDMQTGARNSLITSDSEEVTPEEEEEQGFSPDARASVLEEISDGHPQMNDMTAVLREVKNYINQSDVFNQRESAEEKSPLRDHSQAQTRGSQRCEPYAEMCYNKASVSKIAAWIRDPPVSALAVRFTQHAERDLKEFQPPSKQVSGRPSFQFLQGPEEAAAAIRAVLRADPRSVYRRTRCLDKLFHFTIDTAHITCWFGEDFAEVLRVRSAACTQAFEMAAGAAD
ncbi:hypothetical protein MATL_G00227060 [Megalops atlanticus]|uniref:tRNA (adenine(37)-N6)-methyltransferase n=1 Tax=Megalops atlanticus TaxID=7932 RepID=A0A9D3PJ29_MEGAT|nr:hypothetical protein MATL_G00227060 [Megalops atlanticus]